MKKRGRGNPGVVPGEKQIQRAITLSDRLARKAAKIGNGKVSSGIRIALEAFTDTPQ